MHEDNCWYYCDLYSYPAQRMDPGRDLWFYQEKMNSSKNLQFTTWATKFTILFTFENELTFCNVNWIKFSLIKNYNYSYFVKKKHCYNLSFMYWIGPKIFSCCDSLIFSDDLPEAQKKSQSIKTRSWFYSMFFER